MSARGKERPPAWELLRGRNVLYFRPPPLAGLKVGKVDRVRPRKLEARLRPPAELGSELVPLDKIQAVLFRRRQWPVLEFLRVQEAAEARREEARKKPADPSSSGGPAADE